MECIEGLSLNGLSLMRLGLSVLNQVIVFATTCSQWVLG